MNIENYGTLSVSNNNLEQVLEIISNSGKLRVAAIIGAIVEALFIHIINKIVNSEE